MNFLATLVIFKFGAIFLTHFSFVISLGYSALKVKGWSLCVLLNAIRIMVFSSFFHFNIGIKSFQIFSKTSVLAIILIFEWHSRRFMVLHTLRYLRIFLKCFFDQMFPVWPKKFFILCWKMFNKISKQLFHGFVGW